MNRSLYRSPQSGFSLVTAMIFLIVLSMLAVVAVRGVVTQERMAGNTQDWHLAFQAAEAALRDAEKDVQSSGRIQGDGGFTIDCTDGLCLSPSDGSSMASYLAANDAAWQGSATTGKSLAYGAKTSEAALPGVLLQPRYVVESLGVVGANSLVVSSYASGSPTHRAYRVTAIGFGRIKNSAGTPATKVVLQSVFEH